MNDRLHAKVVTGNFASCLVGSANITAPGLGISSRSNLEVMVEIEGPTPELKALLCRILIEGRAVDDDVYARFQAWLQAVPPPDLKPEDDPGPARTDADPFLVSQLPATSSPRALWEESQPGNDLTEEAIHDLQLLRVDPQNSFEEFRSSLRVPLRESPFFSRILLEVINRPEGFYFGGFKALVQQRCANVPVPHRRDLTTLVQNLYAWIPDVFPDEFEVTRPNYSQLLRAIQSPTKRYSR